MFGIIDLPTYIIGTILVILLPGPNSLYVMTSASRFGLKAGYRAAAGVLVGDSILMLLTVIGAASLLKAVPFLFLLLKVTGAVYLGWLGSQLLGAAYQHYQSRKQKNYDASITVSTKQEPLFRKALSISLLNPKAILFFLSFFIQFVDTTYAHPGFSFLILAFILQFFSFFYLSTLILSGTRLAHFFNTHYVYRILGLCSVGLLFCGFAIKLVFSSL